MFIVFEVSDYFIEFDRSHNNLEVKLYYCIPVFSVVKKSYFLIKSYIRLMLSTWKAMFVLGNETVKTCQPEPESRHKTAYFIIIKKFIILFL